jgi:hypothetical protein
MPDTIVSRLMMPIEAVFELIALGAALHMAAIFVHC